MKLFLQSIDVPVAQVVHILNCLVASPAMKGIKSIEVTKLVSGNCIPVLLVFFIASLPSEGDFML